MRTASIRLLPVVAFALALACVAMVPVAHAGVRVWMDDSWDASPVRDGWAGSYSADRDYCRNCAGTFDAYRPRAAVQYVVIHPSMMAAVAAGSGTFVLRRVGTADRSINVRRTVSPAPAGAWQSQRSRVVSTSRSVKEVERASFEARQSSLVVSSKRAQKVSAKQKSVPVRVASKSAK